VANFVDLYNIRKIRKQKSRDYYILARVFKELYFFYNSRKDYKTKLKGVIKAVLAQFEEEVARYNLKEY
jgi:hypothetical protein